uniref:LRRCT domain-containing protein n=1 Tax=Timema cristinae TaxID=61476 RepID=A0A7R9H354_TIMCR|nr:unnamed protein product [Timema cristinae]
MLIVLQKKAVRHVGMLIILQKKTVRQIDMLITLQKKAVRQVVMLITLQKKAVRQIRMLIALQKKAVRQIRMLIALQKKAVRQIRMLIALQKKAVRQVVMVYPTVGNSVQMQSRSSDSKYYHQDVMLYNFVNDPRFPTLFCSCSVARDEVMQAVVLLVALLVVGVRGLCPPEGDILPCRCTMREEELQIWCSHSDLTKVLAGLQAVGGAVSRPVDELILENNYLPSLPGGAFSSLRVSRLMLRDNGLERVASSWLAGLEDSLLELFVVEPRLRSLPVDCLEQLRGLEAITIQGGAMKRIPRLSGLRRLRYVQIKSPSLVELSPHGFKSLPDLEQLHVVHSPHLTRLEAGLFQDMNRLRLVNISHCGLTWLHPRAMARLPVLTELALRGNRLMDAGMVSRSVRDLPALSTLRLDDNLIERLGEASFVDLPALREVHITGNRILDIHRGAFHRVPELRKLDLSHNFVRHIHPESFLLRSDSGLEELWLVGNAVDHVGELRALLEALPRLRYLDLSHNYLEEIPYGALRGHPTLERLHLDDNRIRHVQREAFMAMPALRELRLRNNSLSNYAEGPLWNLPGLKVRSVLVSYRQPSGIYKSRGEEEGFILVSYRQPSGIYKSRGEEEGCILVSYRQPSGIYKSGGEEEGFILGLDLSYNDLQRLDARLLANLPSLRRLDVSGNVLSMVDPATFLPTPALEHVNLSGNALTSFHPATFRHLLNLYELDLGWNRMREIVPGLPRGIEYLHMARNQVTSLPHSPSPDLILPSLKLLDLTDNGIHHIPPRTFEALSQLKWLRLGGNSLQNLEDDSLNGLTRLEELDLHENRLVEGCQHQGPSREQVGGGLSASGTFTRTGGWRVVSTRDLHENRIVAAQRHSLTELRHLKLLDLRGNRLEQLGAELLRGAGLLQRLDLSSNQLVSVDPTAFDTNRWGWLRARAGATEMALLRRLELVELDASHNALTEVPEALRGLSNLKTLDLSHNRVQELGSAALSGMTSLSELRMSRNRLRGLDEGTFSGLPHLTLLDLDSNELETMASSAVKSLPDLKAIRLGHNRLSSVPESAFSDLPELQSAELQENGITHLAAGAFSGVPQLLLLNLSHNHLSGLGDAGLQGLQSLEVLDLSHNRVGKVAGDSLHGMEWLVELKMDNNYICGIQGSPFNGMPRLRVLSMRNNKMKSLSEPAFQRLRSNIAVLDVEGNPLSCSCHMMWFQAWLREVSTQGPRCADGSLLKEVRLSRQECEARKEEAMVAAPECEGEVAGAPVLGSSQILTTWVNVKDGSTPPPEDTEYFYDEYVEYTYEDGNTTNNSTVMVATEVPLTVQVTSSPNIPQSATVSSHYVPGDTPTLYAGSRQHNKTAQDPLKSSALTTPSPNSGGFTFFGIPLPSISLGGLWGANGRNVDPKPGGMRFIGARGKVDMFPPSETDAHNGFVPMTTEMGGFTPIADPSLMYSKPTNKSLGAHLLTEKQYKINYTAWENPENIPNNNSNPLLSTNYKAPALPQPETPINDASLHKQFAFQQRSNVKSQSSTLRTPIQVNDLDPFIHYTESFEKSLHNKTDDQTSFGFKQIKTNVEDKTPNIMDGAQSYGGADSTQSSRLPSSTNDLGPMDLLDVMYNSSPSDKDSSKTNINTSSQSNIQHKMLIETQSGDINNTQVSIIEKPVDWGLDWFEKQKLLTEVQLAEVPVTTVVPSTSSTPSPLILDSVWGMIKGGKSESNEVVKSEAPSSLSILLAPGAQQPQFRPTASITKVTGSPPLPSPGLIPMEEYLRGPTPVNFPPSTNMTLPPRDGSKDWYFKNYNSTNLRPYIGPGPELSSGQTFERISMYLVLLSITHILI